jgi:hypothetical protein
MRGARESWLPKARVAVLLSMYLPIEAAMQQLITARSPAGGLRAAYVFEIKTCSK